MNQLPRRTRGSFSRPGVVDVVGTCARWRGGKELPGVVFGGEPAATGGSATLAISDGRDGEGRRRGAKIDEGVGAGQSSTATVRRCTLERVAKRVGETIARWSSSMRARRATPGADLEEPARWGSAAGGREDGGRRADGGRGEASEGEEGCWWWWRSRRRSWESELAIAAGLRLSWRVSGSGAWGGPMGGQPRGKLAAGARSRLWGREARLRIGEQTKEAGERS